MTDYRTDSKREAALQELLGKLDAQPHLEAYGERGYGIVKLTDPYRQRIAEITTDPNGFHQEPPRYVNEPWTYGALPIAFWVSGERNGSGYHGRGHCDVGHAMEDILTIAVREQAYGV